MEHKGTVVLETERLILRKFKIYDAEDMFKNWAQDSEVVKFLTWKPHKNSLDTKEVLRKWIKNYKNNDFYQWAITLKDTGEVIGSISVIDHDEKTRHANCGYCLARKYWNMGIMTEALHKVLDFLINTVKFCCVRARHDVRNVASGRVMQKCAMKFEGILRHCAYNNLGICDVSCYSILADDAA